LKTGTGSEEVVMTSLTDVDFIPMRFGKVVAVGTADGPSFYVVLEGVTRDTHLPISIGDTEGFHLSAALTGEVRGGTAYGATVEVEGPSGVTLVDARPSDALNLVALVPAPILVAPEVLADAQARLEGDSPEAILLRRAIETEQTIIQRHPSDP
jgi:bifunctional DNase/RNase